MSTLSELAVAQGRSEADVEWLHLLVADAQLIADLAFADIVLWLPTSDGGFIAAAHSRPSSAATLFYRDFVGQPIKPEWRQQVSDAFATGGIIDTAA
ncbi:histidine kinase N-terminal domain-containing protein, partial [Pseudolysinimonas kribbensis]